MVITVFRFFSLMGHLYGSGQYPDHLKELCLIRMG